MTILNRLIVSKTDVRSSMFLQQIQHLLQQSHKDRCGMELGNAVIAR
jgi:hypothetical protein